MKKKVPFIEQMSQTECGLACVAMISSFYGKKISLFQIRDYVGSGRDGNTLYDLLKVMEHLGFDSKCYKVPKGQLDVINLPAILYWKSNHFVVLEKITNKYYYILDPANGRRKCSHEEFLKEYSEYVLTAKPGETFTKQKETSLWKPYLLTLLKKPNFLAAMLLMNVLLQSFVLISPIFSQRIIDQLVLNKDMDMFSILMIGIVTTIISYFIFNILRNEISIKMFKYLDFHMSWEYFQHLLKIPYSFFQLRQSGDLLYRFSNLRAIRQILSNQIMKSVLDIVLLFVVIGYLFSKSPFLTMCLLTITAVLYVGIFSIRPLMQEVNRDELTKDTKLYSYQTESILGIMNIKTSGAENAVSKHWNNLYSEFANAFVKKERVFGLITSFSGSINFVLPLLIIWIGVSRVSGGALTLGELVAFQTLATYFITTANGLIFQIETFFQLKVYLRRIRDVIDTPAEFDENKTYREIDIQGEMEFKNVSFSYSKNKNDNVLSNINLKIKPGEKIAIIGSSGSGKSTLANLLIGLHTPNTGEIYYDNVPLKELDKSHLRRQIGIVNQSPFLFNQTVYENILSHNKHLSFEDVVRAAQYSQIHDEIMEMPMGYETLMAEQGSNFSGGQRQRIAIARAIASSPKILVLDEATNALDSINEQKIDDYLNSIQCTRIIIAHRLSTIKNASQIIVLEKGKIIASGTHETLYEKNPYYTALFTLDQANELKGGEKYVSKLKGFEKSLF
jgi:ABC-type bacteriocin/lantibiotic exporter with double-glycine peptidase domain